MKITQTIELSKEEKNAIEKVLGLCDEISDISNCSMTDVFCYLNEHSDIIEDYKYSVDEILQIGEIG